MKKQVLKLVSFLCVVLLVAMLAPQRATADEDDPPSRVARLAFARGNVSFNPAGTDDWVSAVVNRPITTGDKLWVDEGARAELQVGTAAIRLSDHTGFSFLNLNDQTTQIRLTEGTLNIRVRRLDDDETFEVDTPNLAFSILRPGRYRINVNEAGDSTAVIVREGEGEVTGGGSAYTLHPREEGWFNGTDQLEADIQGVREQFDDFDQWCLDRDRRADHSMSSRYVSDDVVGYEDLDEYGGWRPVPEYGTVWFPHTVEIGWAPYRYGHWVWISPWGWTWVDDEPWGFAPFHYGRWVVVGGVWGWVPCPPRPVVAVAYVRPVYAPALVAWVGGAHWGIGVSVGGAPAGVAWFPLGPRDVYCPSYHVSQTYVQNVNVSNTTIINKTEVTNVYNNVYVNKTVNVTNIKYQNQTVVNAVTATSHQAFTSAQPVARNMVRVDAREVASAPVAPLTPAVVPQQRSVLGAGNEARVRPPAVVATRAVVAKQAPPPPPAPFAKQQQIVQANGGRPPAISEIRRAEPENTQAARPNVRIAPPARPAPAQNAPVARQDMPQGNPNRPAQGVPPGQANRPQNVPANPANQPGQGTPPGQGNKPATAPVTPGNSKIYSDRPPAARPGNAGNVNPQLEQKHRQELQDLRTRQDQERQRIEQQQAQERQKLEQQNVRGRQQVDQRPPQTEQRPPQPQVDQKPPQAEQRPPQPDQRPPQAEQKPQPQVDRRQQQLEQRQQQQLEQLERKHDQQQQKLEQKQDQEHRKEQQKQDKPPKQEKPAKQDKSDKPHR
jgi:uncharacterized protein DUF6600